MLDSGRADFVTKDSRCSQGLEGVRLENQWISSLLFPENVDLEPILESGCSKNSEVIHCDLRKTQGFWFLKASSA